MNTYALKWIGMAVMFCSLMSCSELRSPHYVGEIVDIPKGDLGDESIWIVDEDTYTIRRTGSNTFVAATMVWNGKTDSYQAVTSPIVLSELDKHLFLQLKDGDEYIILRAACSLDESIVLFTINEGAIAEDIAAGHIAARKDKDNIIMECSKDEQDEYIQNNIDRIFSYDSARVARKIYEDKNADKK